MAKPLPRPLILVDVHNLAWRAFHTTGGLKHNDVPTGVLYGVLRTIAQLEFEWNPKAMVFCFDSTFSKRQQACPSYKANRGNPHEDPDHVKARKECGEQIALLYHEILPNIGFRNLFRARGYEADDLIAATCQQYKKRFCLIVSNDNDLFQCLAPNVSVWNAHKHRIITADSFRDTWGVSPTQWADVKAMAGCHSDNVAGIPGVGEKTACKFLQAKVKPGSKVYQAIVTNNAIWQENLRLVRLPYPGTPTFEILTDETTPKSWRAELDQYGIRSF